MTAEKYKEQMTTSEWEKVFSMSQDKNLYNNLIASLFPTIHGKLKSHQYSNANLRMRFSLRLQWY